MEGVLRVQKFSRRLLSDTTDRTAWRRKWRWRWAKEMGRQSLQGYRQRGKKGLRNHIRRREGMGKKLVGLEGRVPIGGKCLLLGMIIKLERYVGSAPQERKE